MSPSLQHLLNLAICARQFGVRFWAVWFSLAMAFAAMTVGAQAGVTRLWERWTYSYEHAFVVLGISAWLAIRAIRKDPVVLLAPSLRGASALLLVLTLYLAFEAVDFTAGMQAMLPPLLWALVATICGMELALRLSLPAAFLFFAIPIWDLAIVPLQSMTIAAVSAALRSTGFAAFIEGSLVHIPAGTFEIAEGCSGVRYFIVGLTLATSYGLLFLAPWPKRLALIGASAVAAIISNWVRVYSLVVIGDITDMKHYVIAESHDGFGWLVFVCLMLPVLVFGRYLEASEPVPKALPFAIPTTLSSPARFMVAAVLASLAFAVPGVLGSPQAWHYETITLRGLPNLPQGWESIQATEEWRPSFAGPDRVLRFGVRAPSGIKVDVFGAFYVIQRPDGKLLAMNNSLHPGWQSISNATMLVSIGGIERKVQQAQLSDGTETRVVWYWYLLGGVPTDDRVKGKLLEFWALVRGRRDGAVLAVSARCGLSCDTAQGALTDYLALAGQWTESEVSRAPR